MAAIANQLSQADIVERRGVLRLAARAPATGAKSAQLPNVAKTNVTFPEGYKDTFTKYHTINFPATKQVRYYYANKAAVEAAKAGKPLPNGSYLFAEVYAAKLDADQKPVMGADGFFVADKPLLLYRDGARGGLGQGHSRRCCATTTGTTPSSRWTSSIARSTRPSASAATSRSTSVSYTFTLKQLADAK